MFCSRETHLEIRNLQKEYRYLYAAKEAASWQAPLHVGCVASPLMIGRARVAGLLSWAVQILLGHTKIESTVRYLGVDIEDALALAEGTEV